MGSKNLKAIAVRGRNEIHFKNPEKIREFARWFGENWKDNSSTVYRSKYGTAGSVTSLNQDGLLPTRNFIKGTFEYAEEISGEKIRETILFGTDGCYACPIRCKLSVKAEKPFETDPSYGGPEYETIGALGSLCEIGDINAISYANQLCNAYGLDTISTGCSIAFAMECFEENILGVKDTNGLDIRFGNAEAMVKLVEMIALREGIGDVLAEGVRTASKKLGKNSDKFAIHVKGKELPMHEPRGKTGVGLQYALSASGADHMQAAHDPSFVSNVDNVKTLGILEPVGRLSLGSEKVRLLKSLERWWLLLDVVDVCKFTIAPHGCGVFSINQLPEIINAATGWETSLEELLLAVDRSINMARIFNLREGITGKNDTIPERFFEPLQTGPREGARISMNDLNEAVKLYYNMAGWDEKGEPNKSTLQKLYLEEFSS
jgi:aldehyde:ferredoxin oxidoreductase